MISDVEGKSWAERIREARSGGGFTEDDRDAMSNFNTCLVGERLKASGHATYRFSNILVMDPVLIELGTGVLPGDDRIYLLESPIDMVNNNKYDALEKHLAKVQARVDELYGEPPSVNLSFAEREELVSA